MPRLGIGIPWPWTGRSRTASPTNAGCWRGIRDSADVVIDTGGQSLGDLKRLLDGHFGLKDRPGLSVFVTSFSFRRGLPREADLVFDVRFLDNPHYDSSLRPLTGQDSRVGDFIAKDPGFVPFFDNLCRLLEPVAAALCRRREKLSDHRGGLYGRAASGRFSPPRNLPNGSKNRD